MGEEEHQCYLKKVKLLLSGNQSVFVKMLLKGWCVMLQVQQSVIKRVIKQTVTVKTVTDVKVPALSCEVQHSLISLNFE